MPFRTTSTWKPEDGEEENSPPDKLLRASKDTPIQPRVMGKIIKTLLEIRTVIVKFNQTIKKVAPRLK